MQMNKGRKNGSLCLFFIMTLFFSACKMGPNFVSPPAPAINNYGNAPTHFNDHGAIHRQSAVVVPSVPGNWWEAFHSCDLNRVMTKALNNNRSIQSANARLYAAEQYKRMAVGHFFPQADLDASAQREKGPPLIYGFVKPPFADKIPTYNLYSISPSVSFTPDLFGLTQRKVEERAAFVDNQTYVLAIAQLTVEGDIMREALHAAKARFIVQAYREIVASDAENVRLARKRFSTGTVTENDVLMAENQLEQDKANLPTYQQKVDKANDMLALLVGEQPGVWTPPSFTLRHFTLPAKVPLLLPSALVRNRPDILAAEANWHAASAAIGVATAEMFPNITLSAFIAPTANELGDLFHRSNLAWDTMAELTQPLFRGGSLYAKRKVMIGLYHAARNGYEQTVLDALRQVTDNLHTLKEDADVLATKKRALYVAERALSLARSQYAVGVTDFTPLMNAERNYELARIDEANAYADRLLDTAYLYVALGGTGPLTGEG